MPHAILKKLTSEAKRIRAREGGSWKAAVKKAGAKYRAGKLGRVKTHHKKPSGKRRKSIISKARKFHAAEGRAHAKEGRELKSLGSVASHIGHAKSQLKDQIGWAEAMRFAAPKKSTKRKIGKRIAALKAQYRKLC
jgi:hypothetical protein